MIDGLLTLIFCITGHILFLSVKVSCGELEQYVSYLFNLSSFQKAMKISSNVTSSISPTGFILVGKKSNLEKMKTKCCNQFVAEIGKARGMLTLHRNSLFNEVLVARLSSFDINFLVYLFSIELKETSFSLPSYWAGSKLTCLLLFTLHKKHMSKELSFVINQRNDPKTALIHNCRLASGSGCSIATVCFLGEQPKRVEMKWKLHSFLSSDRYVITWATPLLC